jgi:hypothetical protein
MALTRVLGVTESKSERIGTTATDIGKGTKGVAGGTAQDAGSVRPAVAGTYVARPTAPSFTVREAATTALIGIAASTGPVMATSTRSEERVGGFGVEGGRLSFLENLAEVRAGGFYRRNAKKVR